MREVIAYASWPAPQKVTTKVDVFVYVDESVSDAEAALDCLFFGADERFVLTRAGL